MKRFRAVVFDFDGTLADTMEDHFRAWQAAMADYGISLGPEDYYPLEGVRVTDLPKLLFARHRQIPREEALVVRKKEHHYLRHCHFAFYPGAEDLVRRLHDQGVPIAVVTAGLSDRLQRSVPSAFLQQFDAIVTGEDTEEGKPSPAPYLRGAEKLGVRSEECAVVENAPIGIESAKRAGAYCIAITSTVPRRYLEQADEVVDSFERLKDSPVIQGFLESNERVS